MRFFRFVLTVMLTCASASAQRAFTFVATKQDVVSQRLQSAPGNNSEREQKMVELFKRANCPALEEQKISGSKQPNVICTVKGNTDSVIVVGAHFDKVDQGDGIVDNWSGASLLPSILETILAEPRRHTYVFVAFTAEEAGLVGSAQYVKKLSKDQLAKIHAMINMDTLGLGPTEVWGSHSDKQLLELLFRIAAALKSPLTIMNVENVGSTDAESFAEKKVPRTTLHSLTQDTLPILHSSKDKLEAIHMEDYYRSYRLIAAYTVYLDGALN